MSIRSRTVAGLAVAVTAAVALGAGTSVARTQAHRGAAPAAMLKTTIHGVNFQVKSFDDTNFCMQVESGVLPGRTITLQQCGVADNQRWAFSLNRGTTNLILDSQGMCLDGRFQSGDEGLARPVNACQFSPEWKFVYLGNSLIEDIANGKCLSVPGAAANAAVSLADCDPSKVGQQWLVTH
jgi:ricin-type beta-trefoil lectin protein